MNIKISGLSDIVAFDDREADIPEITGIFFRWAVDINGGPIRVSTRVLSSCYKASEPLFPGPASWLQEGLPSQGHLQAGPHEAEILRDMQHLVPCRVPRIGPKG